MSETIELRQANPEETENMAKLDNFDNDVYGYLSRAVTSKLGEYMSIEITDDEEAVPLSIQKTTKNFVVYESSGGHVVGLGVRRSIIESVFGEHEEGDEPSIYVRFHQSDEEGWEEAQGLDEEEADALVAGLGGSDSEDSDDEEEVEVSEEELGLVAE